MHRTHMENTLDAILDGNRKTQPDELANKFYLVSRLEAEHFLEVQFRSGVKGALAYSDLSWMNFNPEGSVLDIDFKGMTVSVEGRGLYPLFVALKTKKVIWVKEADSDMEDSDQSPTFIKEITILPPAEYFDPEASPEGTEELSPNDSTQTSE